MLCCTEAAVFNWKALWLLASQSHVWSGSSSLWHPLHPSSSSGQWAAGTDPASGGKPGVSSCGQSLCGKGNVSRPWLSCGFPELVGLRTHGCQCQHDRYVTKCGTIWARGCRMETLHSKLWKREKWARTPDAPHLWLACIALFHYCPFPQWGTCISLMCLSTQWKRLSSVFFLLPFRTQLETSSVICKCKEKCWENQYQFCRKNSVTASVLGGSLSGCVTGSLSAPIHTEWCCRRAWFLAAAMWKWQPIPCSYQNLLLRALVGKYWHSDQMQH